jgi:hypothetical protein
MSHQLIVVAVFQTPVEAHTVKSKLEAHGIECFLVDEGVISANPLLATAVGGAKLQVKAEDAARALDVLKEN